MALDQVDVDRIGEPDSEMSFLDHLEELRWHLVRSIVAILVCAIVVFMAKNFVFKEVIFGPRYEDFPTYRFLCGLSDFLCLEPPLFNLITRELGEQFIVHMKVSFILGLIISFPYIFWEIWRFIKPGLYEKEQKAARGIVFVCSFLFFLGVAFGYYIISPFAITFLAGYEIEGAIASPTLASYVNYMTMFTLPTGLVFELPIVVYFFSKIGLLTPDFMKAYRRQAFVLILILASIITPPDVMTQLLISVPLYFLYEISIYISKRVVKNLEKELE